MARTLLCPRNMSQTTSSALLRALLLGSLGFTSQACASTDPETRADRSPDGTQPGGEDSGHSPDPDGGNDGIIPTKGCTNPSPLRADYDTGIFLCQEGYLHRAASLECQSRLPRDEAIELPVVEPDGGAADAGQALPDECMRDSDCPREHDRCVVRLTNPSPLCALGPPAEAPVYRRTCAHGCTVDADCGNDAVCVCGELIGTCEPVSDLAGCRSDADCATGALCLQNARQSNFAGYTFACQLPGDTCETDEDCGSPNFCSMAATGRSCQGGAVCGRPFLVAGSPRLADIVQGNHWSDASIADDAALPDDKNTVRRAAEHWTKIGLLEHASVAAFARFTLQLLSVGAPSELVLESIRAQQEELEHTKLAFSLAARYGGSAISPGPLRTDDAIADMTVESILRTTIAEGCFGETRAALEAREGARLATDPKVRRTLERIAEDESRHAALAWRVVQWLLSKYPELRDVARAALAEGIVEPVGGCVKPSPVASAAREHGVLDAGTVAQIHRIAECDVIAPCARALFAAA